MKKILITGSKGFLGFHVVKELRFKYTLFTPDRHNLDLFNEHRVNEYLYQNKPDIVIHLAATCGGIGANKKRPADFFMYNSVINNNIVNACYAHNVKKLVTMGSICSYPCITDVPFKEENIWNGYPEKTNAPYGISKRALMESCKAYNEQYGCNFVHLMPTNLIGENDHFDLENSHVIPALIQKMHTAKKGRKKNVTIWGDGSPTREFLYAGDCAVAIRLAMENYDKPDPINIGTGIETSIKDLTQIVAKIVGFSGEIIYDKSKPNGQPRRCLDVSKAKEEFGFVAKTSLEEAIRKTYGWYLDEYISF